MTMSAISDEAVVKAVVAAAKTPSYGTAQGKFDSMQAALEAVLPGLVEAAVHEAYVNAQRAVAALSLDGATVGYRHGRETMQEDAVRAIREAAEEAGK